ncbi:hypothetical protein BCR34DRAFT_366666 [Clohesyomyces aquaticus]|uniref:Uncharacterized protein n=1 Tax=Clohesyomyces aquaticus TaxID=1231657 RepID=A0A1Y1ZHI0_9PLEO|nr:hypothetical protein BCR34DRAFT_366666 [Clohesyomyces aquaticus]
MAGIPQSPSSPSSSSTKRKPTKPPTSTWKIVAAVLAGLAMLSAAITLGILGSKMKRDKTAASSNAAFFSQATTLALSSSLAASPTTGSGSSSSSSRSSSTSSWNGIHTAEGPNGSTILWAVGRRGVGMATTLPVPVSSFHVSHPNSNSNPNPKTNPELLKRDHPAQVSSRPSADVIIIGVVSASVAVLVLGILACRWCYVRRRRRLQRREIEEEKLKEGVERWGVGSGVHGFVKEPR